MEELRRAIARAQDDLDNTIEEFGMRSKEARKAFERVQALIEQTPEWQDEQAAYKEHLRQQQEIIRRDAEEWYTRPSTRRIIT